MSRIIELLSPAKDYEAAVAAVNSGADAVYIGADSFSARKNASNSIGEIEKVISYAHSYYSRVYIALNTLLFENELEPARKLIYQLHEAGADALIFQDAAILEMDIPPIRLHASTQFNNYEIERIKFLSDSGIDRIILARELNLEQIKNISGQTNTELEVFVHGALCVSMSGQCFMSYAAGGRSANRGECAQPCRKFYSLHEKSGKKLNEAYYLSLKDLNRSMYLKELIDAGVSSLKIEGRLKGADYVKNVTAFYRQKLDAALKGTEHKKASSGNCSYTFKPDVNKTFNREFTDFDFIKPDVHKGALRTPKSLGELTGEVVEKTNEYAVISSDVNFIPGDGICYFRNSVLTGANVTRVEGKKVFFNCEFVPEVGTKIYRNNDKDFQSVLNNSDSAVRKIDIAIKVAGSRISAVDSDGNRAEIILNNDDNAPVDNKESYFSMLKKSFSKTGDTVFHLQSIEIENSFNTFFKISEINKFRRELLEILFSERLRNYPSLTVKIKKTVPYYIDAIDSSYNVINSLSEKFYKKRNVNKIEFGVEKKIPPEFSLMKSKYCILSEIGLCGMANVKDSYYLKNENGDMFNICVDCSNCIMYINKKRSDL